MADHFLSPPGCHFRYGGAPLQKSLGLQSGFRRRITLRAFDDLHMTTQDKSVTVSAATGAPVITSAAAASVMVGTPFNYVITASGNPSGFGENGLPAELTFSNGVIAGTPAFAGTRNILLSATNASGVGYGNLALTMKLPVPVITNATNADGLVSALFSYTVSAANLTTLFSASGLPAGLTLDPVTGAITGTPTTAGTYAVTLGATNSAGGIVAPLTIVISSGAAPLPTITSPLVAVGTMGSSFTYAIAATGNPTSFFAIGLPVGLSFDPTSGHIWGTPSVAGTFAVTLRATNRGGTATASLALSILDPSAEPPPVITAGPTATPNPAAAGQSVAFSVIASDPNGHPLNYAWNFGDSSTSTDLAPTHTYLIPGPYPVSLIVSNGQGGLAATSMVVVVTSAPVPGVLQFSNATFVTDKSDRTALVTISRLAGSSGVVQVTCRTSGGTARAGQDYVSVATNIVWADGDGVAKNISIPLIDDDLLVEPDKTVSLHLTSPTGGASVGTLSNATLQITANTKPDNGLVAHWTFDETNGMIAADVTGNGHNGSVSNATWISGKINNALRFNGTGAGVTISTNSSLDMKAGDQFTITFWMAA